MVRNRGNWSGAAVIGQEQEETVRNMGNLSGTGVIGQEQGVIGQEQEEMVRKRIICSRI